MKSDYLVCGDCAEIMRQMPDKSIDLIVTDPPYLISTTGAGYINHVRNFDCLKPMQDGFSDEILDEMCRVMKKINIYIFCSKRQIIPLLDYFVKHRKCNWHMITWHKTNPPPSCSNMYLNDTEYCLFFREKGVRV